MVDPSACRWCGISQRRHYTQVSATGLHQWTEPTWEQRRAAIIANIQEQQAIRRARRKPPMVISIMADKAWCDHVDQVHARSIELKYQRGHLRA